jgi:hypothetical protein
MGKRKKISTEVNLFLEEPDVAYQRYEDWARPGLRGLRGGNSPVLSGPNLRSAAKAAPLYI